MARPDAREAAAGMAGALLRVARESAGMSIDAVAQHLKLAPRQVKALEDGDYTHLPGRTFVRGFVRNYARLVKLDPERVLGALPGGATAPALEAPTLQPTATTMGELPSSESTKTPWARWAIPLILAAIVAVAAVYEWKRPPGESRVATQKEAPAPSAPATPTPPSNAATTSLPNPLASNAPAADAAPPTSADTQSAAALAAPTPTVAAPATGTATPGAGAAGTQTVDLAFRDTAWVEVRDRDGRVLLTGTNRRGTVQTVSGTPPLAIVIGNALNVTLRYKGEPVDLTPFTQKNIAQLTLP